MCFNQDRLETLRKAFTDGCVTFSTFHSVHRMVLQAFRFMVGPGHCLMISKYGLSLSKAVGPMNPSFLVVKKSHFNKSIHLTVRLRTPQNRKYM